MLLVLSFVIALSPLFPCSVPVADGSSAAPAIGFCTTRSTVSGSPICRQILGRRESIVNDDTHRVCIRSKTPDPEPPSAPVGSPNDSPFRHGEAYAYKAMTTNQNQGAEPQLIRMTDQHGRAVRLDVRQDGKRPGLVPPGRRVRFKIRAHALAYRVELVALGDCEHWHVYDVRVGNRSQFTNAGDSPDEDGIPGAVFSPGASSSYLSFETVQTGMDLVLDVAYCGPAPDGAPLDCSLRCTAAYGDERDEAMRTSTDARLRRLAGAPEKA